MFGMHGSSSKRVVFASKKKFHNHFRKSLINLWVLCLFDDIKERSFPFPAHISPKSKILKILGPSNEQLEDLKVLRRSPDLLNNVKIGQGQLQLLMEQILFLPYTFWSSDLNNLMINPSNSPVISEKKMFR